MPCARLSCHLVNLWAQVNLPYRIVSYCQSLLKTLLQLPAFVYRHDISKSDAAGITKLNIEMFHHESWKAVYFAVKGHEAQNSAGVCFLHSCEYSLLLVLVIVNENQSFSLLFYCRARKYHRNRWRQRRLSVKISLWISMSCGLWLISLPLCCKSLCNLSSSWDGWIR